ncbi:hypothetical protein LCGC14_2651670 [marine sediment metagenome]|uniref:Uncharacterized protein n=1 Tax=marine sediment metagenome TaxID=412755 RepID=A0A0F8ZUN8_9ZZZZ
MGVAEIITIITSVITGIAKVTKVTREALAKSLDEMARDVRDGGLIPEELLAKVEADGERLDKVRDGLPD